MTAGKALLAQPLEPDCAGKEEVMRHRRARRSYGGRAWYRATWRL